MSYRSRDGEEGYPGNLDVTVLYRMGDDDALHIDYQAVTDKDTPVNLTNHTYWNLAGGGDILGEIVTLHARRYTPVDSTLIPTGVIAPVAGTPMDFTEPKPVGRDLGQLDNWPRGYDVNFVIDRFGSWPGPRRRRLRSRYGQTSGGADRPAGRAVLHRQFPRRFHPRQRRSRLPAARRPVPRDPAFSGRSAPSQFSPDHPPSRGNLPDHHGLSVFDPALSMAVHNSLQRFSDRVADYVRYRPGYPPELMRHLAARTGLGPGDAAADIGSGTGIFTRLLLEAGAEVFAVEPNADMRAAAEAELAGTAPAAIRN